MATRRVARAARAARGAVLVAALLCLPSLLAGCGDDDDGADGAPPSSSSSTATTTTTSAPPAPAAPVDLGAVRFRLTEVARLDQPVALAVRPGTTPLYVAEKEGRVRVLDGGSAPLLDLTGEIASGGEQGLLGIAFSPDGRHLYTSFTNRQGDSRLVEWTMGAGPRDVDLASRRQVLALDQPAANHNGGTILFGPDGRLWFGLGDGGGSGDRFGNAQDRSTLLGDILRLDPRPSGDQPYGIPADNPYADGRDGRPEIAVSGVRNPWKFSFDRRTGDLWVGDVGQDAVEEIDLLRAGAILGANLGWPFLEGSRPYSGRTPPSGLTGPVHEYGRNQGRSVVGGYVYRGAAIPSLVGAYVFADTYDPTIRLLAVDAAGTRSRDSGVDVPGGTVVGFGEDAAGELYVMTLGGGLFRFDPA